MERALERHNAGAARVIPIILRRVRWEDVPFSKLQALPTEGKPVTHWRRHDDAYLPHSQQDISETSLHAISHKKPTPVEPCRSQGSSLTTPQRARWAMSTGAVESNAHTER